MLQVAGVVLAMYVVFVTFVFVRQRSMLYFPSRDAYFTSLTPWVEQGRTIGYCREVREPRTVWLMMHGNAGQAAHRDYVLPCLADDDALYVLEYPGYGSREGTPCRESFDRAAREAYRLLRTKYSGTPLCVLGESIGSGPACMLAGQASPPDKIVLVVPFDSLGRVASRHFFFLPVGLLLLDDWNNIVSLQGYGGPVDVFGALEDAIIPVEHAKTLAERTPGARFIPIDGGHNDWSDGGDVQIRLDDSM